MRKAYRLFLGVDLNCEIVLVPRVRHRECCGEIGSSGRCSQHSHISRVASCGKAQESFARVKVAGAESHRQDLHISRLLHYALHTMHQHDERRG